MTFDHILADLELFALTLMIEVFEYYRFCKHRIDNRENNIVFFVVGN